MRYKILYEDMESSEKCALVKLNEHFGNSVLFFTVNNIQKDGKYDLEYVVPKALTHFPYSVLDKRLAPVFSDFIRKIKV